MNILYYSWGEISTADMIETLQELGHSVYAELHELSFYLSDEFAPTFRAELSASPYDLIFTFNFIPAISDLAEQYHVPYVSWVYDCPHITLFSTSLHNSCNYLFLFDRDMQQTVLANHAKHAYHQPLAVHTKRLSEHLHFPEDPSAFFPAQYQHDISFVGSLYEETAYGRLKNIAPHLQGYLHGIIAAQKQIWGQDLISAVLSPDRVAEIFRFLPFIASAEEFITPKEVFASIIQKQITSEERIEAINRLSQLSPVALYTGSDTSLCPNAIPMGTISYTAQMPDVFYRSKINLNITLRSITSGIPLRAIDILGCGGFLLTNYQPELCEFFTPGVDFVYFEDMDDLEQKVAYYLAHDEERKSIAWHGYQTVSAQFSYRRQVQNILDTLNACL